MTASPARPGIQAGRKIVPYLDLPLQHVNDRCLKRMQRRVNRAATEELLGKLRSAVPGLALRTTFIDRLNEILFGKQPVSVLDDLVKEWRTNGGDKIRAEYEQAFQADH